MKDVNISFFMQFVSNGSWDRICISLMNAGAYSSGICQGTNQD